MNKTAKILLVSILVLVMISSVVLAATTTKTASAKKSKDPVVEKKGFGGQLLTGLKCVFWDCGWVGWVVVILPAVAIYVAKKYIFVG